MIKTNKKSKYVFSVFVMFFAFFASITFFGCNELTSNIESPSGFEKNTTKKSLSGYIANSDGSRTILSSDDTNSYAYYLYGISDNSKTHFEKITISGGTFSVDLDNLYWTLFLYAVKDDETVTDEDDAKEKALMAAVAIADLKKSSATVNFILSPENVVGGAGYANLLIKLSNDDDASVWNLADLSSDTIKYENKIYVEILNPINGTPIKYSDGTSTAETISLSGSEGRFGSTTKSIPKGTYSFSVTFKDKDGNIVGHWSDLIEILTGRTCNSTVYIPNVLGTRPLAPATFTASLVRNSWDADKLNYYKVHFQWENTPNNENYYEMQLLNLATLTDFTITGNGYDYTDENGDEYWAKFPEEYKDTMNRRCDARLDYVSGSLVANATELTLYLPIGKRYWARIRSVNQVGVSDWKYVRMTGGNEDGYKSINLFRMIYNFNGGIDSVNPGETQLVSYFSQNDPNPANTVGIHYYGGSTITKDGKPFAGWTTDISQVPIIHETGTYTGFENITLYADFE